MILSSNIALYDFYVSFMSFTEHTHKNNKKTDILGKKSFSQFSKNK